MGLFSGVEKAKASLGGNYLKPGNYRVRIDKVKQGESRKNGGFIAVEMTILEVLSTTEDKPHLPGEQATYMYMTKFDSFLGNWKAFVMGVMDCNEAEVTEEESAKIIGETQPFSGLTVPVQAVNVKTKAGGDFTKAIWGPAEELQEAE